MKHFISMSVFTIQFQLPDSWFIDNEYFCRCWRCCRCCRSMKNKMNCWPRGKKIDFHDGIMSTLQFTYRSDSLILYVFQCTILLLIDRKSVECDTKRNTIYIWNSQIRNPLRDFCYIQITSKNKHKNKINDLKSVMRLI